LGGVQALPFFPVPDARARETPLAELVRMVDQLGIAPDGRAEPVPKDSPDTPPRGS
jgi:hypothetical protein